MHIISMISSSMNIPQYIANVAKWRSLIHPFRSLKIIATTALHSVTKELQSKYYQNNKNLSH